MCCHAVANVNILTLCLCCWIPDLDTICQLDNCTATIKTRAKSGHGCSFARVHFKWITIQVVGVYYRDWRNSSHVTLMGCHRTTPCINTHTHIHKCHCTSYLVPPPPSSPSPSPPSLLTFPSPFPLLPPHLSLPPFPTPSFLTLLTLLPLPS